MTRSNSRSQYPGLHPRRSLDRRSPAPFQRKPYLGSLSFCGRPARCKRFLNVRPLMQRWSCGPVWEFTDRNQIINACSAGTMATPGSSGPVSPIVAPNSPSTDYISDDLRSTSLALWLGPELCSPPALRVAPRRSAPSHWQARPLPACAVCESASGAKNPWPDAFARPLHAALLPMMRRRLRVRSPIWMSRRASACRPSIFEKALRDELAALPI
jgi:hypothetical protein